MKGQKTGGRKKGTPNKVTTEIREFLASLVFDNMDLIQMDVKNMTTEQRMVFIPKILPYITPKVKPVSEEEERQQASNDLKNISKTAQAIMFLEQQQEKEEKAEEEQQTEQLVQNEQDTDNTPQQDIALPETDSTTPKPQEATQPQADKQYTVTDEEYHEFMTQLCKDLEPYMKYNNLDEVDFEAIQKQKAEAKAAAAVKAATSEQDAMPESPTPSNSTERSTISKPSQKLAQRTAKAIPQRQHIPFYKTLKNKRKNKKRR